MFVGFAENCGDAFTAKIWTIPNDDQDFKAGGELTRTIVKPRKLGSIVTPTALCFA